MSVRGESSGAAGICAENGVRQKQMRMGGVFGKKRKIALISLKRCITLGSRLEGKSNYKSSMIVT